MVTAMPSFARIVQVYECKTTFPASQPLPDGPPGPQPERDVVTYKDIWLVADAIQRESARGGFGGWQAIGKERAIGVIHTGFTF